MYRFSNSIEDMSIRKIQAGIIGIKNKTKTVKEANLNYFFDKLKPLNKEMHDDLYAQYVQVVRKINEE